MSVARHGWLLLPVTRMGLAPLSNAFGVLRVTEVVAVGGFAQPPVLAGQLAGVPATGLVAVTLAISVTVIGEEKVAATAALTSLRPQAHR